MRIEPEYDRDPLRKKKYRVVNEEGFIVHTSEEPIEMLRLAVGAQHAVNSPNSHAMIVDEERNVVESYASYYVEPSDDPPDDARIALRNKWYDNVLRFLLPLSLYTEKDAPEKQDEIKAFLAEQKIEVESRPDGGAVRFWRNGELLCSWGC